MIAGFSRPDYTGGQGAELTSATSPGQVAYGPPVHFIIDKARPKAYLIELSKRTVQSVSRSSLTYLMQEIIFARYPVNYQGAQEIRDASRSRPSPTYSGMRQDDRLYSRLAQNKNWQLTRYRFDGYLPRAMPGQRRPGVSLASIIHT